MKPEKHDTINAAFDAVAQCFPDYCAIIEGEKRINYRDLRQKAEHVAQHLLHQKSKLTPAQATAPVAIYQPSSIEFVIAKLAILKAGLAYLPLDLKYPPQRINAILSKAEVAVVLSSTDYSALLPESSWKVCNLDKLLSEPLASPEIPLPEVKPNDLAYIIFTSGSTGIPKGASIRHENLMNVVHWTHSQYNMQPGEVGAQVTRVVFDASVWEFWANLLIGNTVIIIPEQFMLDPDELRDQVCKHRINYIFLPTPIGEIFISQKLPEGACLKWAWVGGDRLLQRPSPLFEAKVANIYGPTECCIVCVHDLVLPGAPDDYPPIGIPVSNCEIYILDENLQPVPTNSPGEICIGGKGVGNGYYNAPDLTEPVFLPDPFCPGGRLYRSGDLGMKDENGLYHCLGRIDFQVKIRGYRIELGEIEAVINLHAAISNVIVLAEGDSKELIAYYTTSNKEAVPEAELRQLTQSKLADYMIPARFVHVEEFPYTSNGKIDRKSLSRLLQTREASSPGMLPETELEQNVAEIWAQVLKQEQIFLSDRFYALGGHSIKAAQVLSLIRTAFRVNPGLSSLLSDPSLAEFCELLRNLKPDSRKHISSNPDVSAYPLAWGQEGLWYYWKLDPARLDYIVLMRFDLKGKLDPSLLRESILYLQERHPIMRGAYRMKGGKPEQYFRAEQPLSFEHHIITEGQPAVTAANYVTEHWQIFPFPQSSSVQTELEHRLKNRAFDLENEALAHYALLSYPNDEHVLYLALHHIITDGWSMGVWQKELVSVYSSLSQGQAPQLKALPLNYGDFCIWQRQTEPDPELLNYWRRILADAPEPVDLPRTRAGYAELQGRRIWWKLGSQTSKALTKYAQEQGLSLYAVLLGLFKLQLYSYTQQEDMILMSIYGGRDETNLRDVLGLLTNLFFIRSKIDPQYSLTHFLRELNSRTLEALQHISYPFEKLLQELFPRHDSHSEALARIVFIMQNYPQEQDADDKLRINAKEIGTGFAKFDLLFTVEEDEDGLFCWIEYRQALYEHSMIERFARQFTQLCEGFCSHPELLVKDLDILLPEEKEILATLNHTQRNFRLNCGYTQLFADSVREYAQRIALEDSEGELSYLELDSLADNLAQQLLALSAGEHDIIGVSLPRSRYLAASLLAIWKLGAVYLPLDPGYPASRLTFMIEDSGLKLIICNEDTGDTFRNLKNAPTLLYPEPSVTGNYPPLGEGKSRPEATAYLIYTSGSTGMPKAVMISHRNLVNHNQAVMELFELNPDDRILQFGSPSFDLSLEEILPTWLAGGTLVFRTEEASASIRHFWDFIQNKAITVIDIPTAFWHALVNEIGLLEEAPFLRLCIIGGEKALAEKALLWQYATGSQVRLINTYGPTETTIIATSYAGSCTGDSYPIGKPIANLTCLVLDKHMRLMPLGAIGELHIGGEGVGLGYLNLPEQTARVFIDDPYSVDSNGKLYKSGDLVRISEDGLLWFEGRKDKQVKLLGHRIEPEEVAARLRDDPAVKDAIVIYKTTNEHAYLAAYVILQESVSLEDIRNRMTAVLPPYMLPSQYIQLESFPLTVNGKLDLSALPDAAPEIREKEQGRSFYTPEQEVLCKIIAEILGKSTVSIDDNFFELGGNSILSMQLIQRLRYAGLDLTVDKLFTSNNLEQMAEQLRLPGTSSGPDRNPCLIELNKGQAGRKALVLLHSLPGDVLGYVNLLPELPPELPVYGLQALGLEAPEQAHRSIREMAEFYLSILDKSGLGRDVILAGWCFGGRVAVEMALLIRERSKTMPRVLLFEAYAYNPVPELTLSYKAYRIGLLLKSWKKLPHLLRSRLRDKAGHKPEGGQEDVFRESGLFQNRFLVRDINAKAIFSAKLPHYPGELVLFKAKRQDPNMLPDPSLGWNVFAPKLIIHEVDCTHENILKQPHAKVIADCLRDYL